MSVLFELAIALFVGKILGEVSERLGLPSLVGYIITGFALVQLQILNPEHIHVFGAIGLILLLFLAAFQEANTEELLQNKYVSVFFGAGGVIISLLLGLLIGYWFGMSWFESFFLGTTLSATSISISLGIFINTGKLNTNIGRAVLGSAIVDDILALLLLAILSGYSLNSGAPLESLGMIIGGIIIFAILVSLSVKILPSCIELARKMRIEEGLFSIILVIVLLFAYVADVLGLSIVIGAFFAGIVLSKIQSSVIETKQFSEKLSATAYGFFVPFFFIQIGAELEPVFDISLLTIVIVVAGFLGKIISAYIGHKITPFSLKELTIMAFARLPRGEVTLVIAALGKSLDIISVEIFNALLLLVFITVIVTPLILTPLLKNVPNE